MTKTSISVLCAVGAAMTAPVLRRSDADIGRVYMTPNVGYLRADSERPTDRDNVLGGFAVGNISVKPGRPSTAQRRRARR